MCDVKKTKKVLVEELQTLRSRIAELERVEVEHGSAGYELKQYKLAVESAHDAIFFKDQKSRYIIANNKALEAFGLSREQVIGKSDYQIMADKDEARRNIEDDRFVFRTGKPKEITKRMTGTDGQKRWFQAIKVPQFDDKGKIIGLVGIARDITEHRRTEEALRANETNLQALFNSVNDFLFVLDMEGNILLVNAIVLERLGYSEAELLSEKVLKVHPPERHEEAAAIVADIVAGKAESCPIPLMAKDGTLIPVETHVTRGRWGRQDVLFGVSRDITERKQAEEALKESEQRFRSLVETSSDWVWEIDRNSIYTYASPKVKDLLGYEPAEIIGKTPFDFMPPDEAERVGKFFKDMVEHRKPFDRLENTNLHKDGRLVVLETSGVPIFGEDDSLLGYRGIDRDITERKRAEEALRESEEKFRTFMETASDLMHITDKSANFIYVNEAMAKTLGYSKEEMIGMHITDILGEESKKRFEANSRKLIAEGEIRADSVWVTKEGEKIYGEITVVAVYDGDGEYAGSRAIFRDITERKQAQEALQKARDELEIRVEQRTADLAKVVEELRNEVAERKSAEEKLLIYQKRLRSLASELSLAEERTRRRIATNVHDRIGQNLAISKIKLESLRKSVSSQDLAKSLDEIGKLIAQTIESSRSLTFELSPPVLYELGFEAAVEWLVRQARQQHGLSTDFENDGQEKPLDHNVRVLLFQAVRELLVNVVKHAKARRVTVSTRRVGNEIQVSVEDDGVGFDASGNGSHSYKAGGFGLFNIGERLGHIGGWLDIESRPNQGTRVTLAAPINHESENGKDKRK